MAMKMAKWTGAFKNSWEHFLLYRDGFLAGQRSKWSAETDHQPSNQVCVWAVASRNESAMVREFSSFLYRSPPAAAMVFHFLYHPQSTVDGQQPGPPPPPHSDANEVNSFESSDMEGKNSWQST
jgi:hypothetical protein